MEYSAQRQGLRGTEAHRMSDLFRYMSEPWFDGPRELGATGLKVAPDGTDGLVRPALQRLDQRA